jgi:hypothetical protein
MRAQNLEDVLVYRKANKAADAVSALLRRLPFAEISNSGINWQDRQAGLRHSSPKASARLPTGI